MKTTCNGKIFITAFCKSKMSLFYKDNLLNFLFGFNLEKSVIVCFFSVSNEIGNRIKLKLDFTSLFARIFF